MKDLFMQPFFLSSTIYTKLDAITLALEPEWEARFEPNSYGFRLGRSCHDAIVAIYSSIKQASKWVLDADISKCFDKINHKTLLQKLNSYPSMRRLIKGWLKAGVMDNGTFSPTNEGTPQGGIISPLLANIALHGMEERITQYAEKMPGEKIKNRRALTVVRYADDFVIMHKSKEVVEECQKIIESWLKDIDLELKPSKTKLVHTMEGFDFLGFNIRQYTVGKNQSKKGFKTFIKPSKKKMKEHWEQLSYIIEKYKAASQETLIKELKPIIRGWCNYNRSQVSKEAFSKMDYLLWNKLQRWGYRRHPNKSKTWVNKKYWGTKVEKPKKPWEEPKIDNWVFMTNEDNYLPKHAKTKIVRHVKVKEARSPFDGDLVYWNNRMAKHPEMSSQKGKLLNRQKGKCAHCGLMFRDGDSLETHHIIPRAQGGNDQLKNLELLHLHCHDAKHRTKVIKHKKSITDPSELDNKPF
ncbi:MAG: group II intron reverse transcriptase/maturase [Moorea sp. SIO2I5]|nr:group II intron reverse transcriptase/maturase [Moorena sp. SIO2I5]